MKKQATPIEKVKQFVKAKFKKPAIDDIDNQDCKSRAEEDDDTTLKSKSSNKGEAFVSFFYTSDKFISQFEDKDIIEDIQKEYPMFMSQKATDSEMKKTICEFIQDKKFIETLMAQYDMTIMDFLKFIFRLDIGIFKGAFLTKIGKIVNNAGYDVKLRK